MLKKAIGRRNFLGLLGVSAVAGPKVLPKAAEAMSLDALSIPGTLGNLASASSDHGGLFSNSSMSPIYATSQLAKLALKTAADFDKERARFNVYQLTPDIASLRSVSMGFKMHVMREQAYKRWNAERFERLTKAAAGIDIDDD